MNEDQQYEDRELTCKWELEKGGKVCGEPFTFTARDQEFYAEKGYSEPKYCRTHREARKQRFNSNKKPA